jgi:hypothetical protein
MCVNRLTPLENKDPFSWPRGPRSSVTVSTGCIADIDKGSVQLQSWRSGFYVLYVKYMWSTAHNRKVQPSCVGGARRKAEPPRTTDLHLIADIGSVKLPVPVLNERSSGAVIAEVGLNTTVCRFV